VSFILKDETVRVCSEEKDENNSPFVCYYMHFPTPRGPTIPDQFPTSLPTLVFNTLQLRKEETNQYNGA